MPDNLPAVPDEPAPADTSYEVDLGDELALPVPVTAGDGLPLPPEEAARLPVIPEHLRTLAGIRGAVAARGADLAHGSAYHAARSPKYLLLATVWAVAGLLLILARLIGWWWLAEQGTLRSEAVIAGDSREWMKLHQHARNVRRDRGMVLGGLAAALLLGI